MRKITIRTTLLAAAIAALAGGMAMADSDNTMRGRGMGYGMGHGMGRMMSDDWMRGMMRGFGPMMGYSADAMLDRVDGRLAFIRTELKIRDDQAEKWDSFAKVMRDTAETHNSMMRSMWGEMGGDDEDSYRSKPLPERLSIHEAQMEAGLEQMKAVRVAVDDLYAALDDAQKNTADEIMMPMMGFGMGMMMMH